jgi:hypothetical protein
MAFVVAPKRFVVWYHRRYRAGDTVLLPAHIGASLQRLGFVL